MARFTFGLLDANGATPTTRSAGSPRAPATSYEASVDRLGDGFVVAW